MASINKQLIQKTQGKTGVYQKGHFGTQTFWDGRAVLGKTKNGWGLLKDRPKNIQPIRHTPWSTHAQRYAGPL